jgi:hypothetical protein
MKMDKIKGIDKFDVVCDEQLAEVKGGVLLTPVVGAVNPFGWLFSNLSGKR